jgi:hypothetical protein
MTEARYEMTEARYEMTKGRSLNDKIAMEIYGGCTDKQVCGGVE